MIKAILRYTDCLQDGKKVFTILASNKITVVGTKSNWSMYPKVVVLVKDYDHLSCLLHELNTSCTYEVRLVKYHTVKGK